MLIFCPNCQEQRKTAYPFCPVCESNFCLICNCTDEEGCIEGCSWERPDLCDLCAEQGTINDETKYFIISGSAGDFEDLKKDAAESGETIWTVLKNARHGDRVFFYFVGPISAIVGDGVIVGDIWINDEFGSPWEGYPMAEIKNISFYDEPIRCRVLRSTFGNDWRHWKYPVCNREVPFVAEVLRPFLELVEQQNRKNYSENYSLSDAESEK